MMSDELAGEKIVTITSPKAVGSTDAGKEAAPAQPPQLFLTMNAKMYSLERFEEDFVNVSVKEVEVDLLNELEVTKLYHCDGLVLCVAKDKDDDPKLLLWNPNLCQTRWIEPRENFNIRDRHAIGYDDDSDSRNHKILRFVDECTPRPERKREMRCEIYEIRSDSWRVLEVVKNNPEWLIDLDQRGVSVKGNTYFFAHHFIPSGYGGSIEEIFLICFDFTKESFGPRLPLPFNDYYNAFNGDVVTLSSCFRRRGGDDDEKLAVLVGGFETGFFEIWVTLTVDPNRASWSKFLRMEPGPFATYGFKLYPSTCGGSFFVDEENKVAVLFELFQLSSTKFVHRAFVFGQDGSFKSKSCVNLGEALIFENRSLLTNKLYKAARHPLVCSSFYRPSLVQVNQPLVHKRKSMSPSAAQRSSVKLSKRDIPTQEAAGAESRRGVPTREIDVASESRTGGSKNVGPSFSNRKIPRIVQTGQCMADVIRGSVEAREKILSHKNHLIENHPEFSCSQFRAMEVLHSLPAIRMWSPLYKASINHLKEDPANRQTFLFYGDNENRVLYLEYATGENRDA